MSCTGYDHIGILKKRLEYLLFVSGSTQTSSYQKIDSAVVKVAMQRFGICGLQVEHNAWKAAREPIGDCRHEAHAERRNASDPYFTRGGIGEKLYLPHTLTQFIEYRHSAIQQ